MPLYEFFCDACRIKFEQITSSSDPDQGRCPKCNDQGKTRKLISRFKIAGQGDLRESTFDGCHEYDGAASHDHHGHDHGDSSGDSGDSE